MATATDRDRLPGLHQIGTLFLDRPYAEVHYVSGEITEAEVRAALEAKVLTFHYSDGEPGEAPNPFRFSGPKRAEDTQVQL